MTTVNSPQNYRVRCETTSKVPGCEGVVEITNIVNTSPFINYPAGAVVIGADTLTGVIHAVSGNTTIPVAGTIEPGRVVYIGNASGGAIAVGDGSTNGFVSGVNIISNALTLPTNSIMFLIQATNRGGHVGTYWYQFLLFM